MNEMYGIFHGMYMLPRTVVSVNVVGRCIVALAMKIFLNLPLVSVTVMEIFLLYYIMLLHTINRWKEVWKQSYSCAMINIR